MRKTVLASAALAGGLLMTALVWSSAQATTSVPNPQSALGTGGDVIHVGRGGGRGGGGRGGFSRGGGGGGHALRGGGGGGRYAYRGGGGGGRYAYRGGGKYHGYKGGKHYAYKNYGNYNRYKNYGHYNRYRRYGWYGLPYISYGYGGGCNWLYRNAVATGSSYWWNRYYQCTGSY